MRRVLLASVALPLLTAPMLTLTACDGAAQRAATVAQTPIPAADVARARAALTDWGIAKGVAQTALLAANIPPGTKASIGVLIDQGDKAVTLYSQGVNDAATAGTLGSLAETLLRQAADYVHVLSNTQQARLLQRAVPTWQPVPAAA